MVAVKEKIIKGKKYYYLAHSHRNGKTITTKEIYLGDKLPLNLEQIQKEFINQIYSKEWFGRFDSIKISYLKQQKNLPLSAAKKAQTQFATKYTYNTNRIEGSTLTLKDTANLLERGITPANKPTRDIKETEAHKELFYEMLNFQKELSLQIVLYWHKQLLNSTLPDIAGKIRIHQVVISGSKFLPPSPVEVDTELNSFFSWYNKNKNVKHPVELAALVHLKFVTIHPFTDGNGRISRLMMNFILKQHKFPLFDIPYTKRNGYYNSLERSQVKKEAQIFLQWFFKRYLEENKKYLHIVQNHKD